MTENSKLRIEESPGSQGNREPLSKEFEVNDDNFEMVLARNRNNQHSPT